MKIKPLNDKVLIQREEIVTKTSGGIIIPDTASKEKPSMGVVMAVGDGAKDENGKIIPMVLKVGDKVLFSKWGGSEVPNDESLLILKESDVLGVIQE